jgi:hypothetical protein
MRTLARYDSSYHVGILFHETYVFANKGPNLLNDDVDETHLVLWPSSIVTNDSRSFIVLKFQQRGIARQDPGMGIIYAYPGLN